MYHSDRPMAQPGPGGKGRRRNANEVRPKAHANTAQPKLRPPQAAPGQLALQLPERSTLPAGMAYAREDGVSHINIYSRGQTELGRMLSHFYRSPFKHPFYGKFNSMEGFWYYVKAAKPDDQLRRLVGFEAKLYGKELPTGPLYDSFYDVIVEANFHKIVQNPRIAQLMVDSTLPFDHYYLFPPGPIFVRQAGFEWLVKGFEDIRAELKSSAAAQREPAWPSARYQAHLD